MNVVAHNGARLWGGAERATALLLAGLSRRGHTVLLLCNDALVARRAEALGVPTEVLPLGGDAAVLHALRLARRLRRAGPDVFLIGTFKKTALAALGARLARVPRVVARIGLETDVPRSAKYRIVLPRWVHAVVANASRVVPAFVALPGYSAERVSVIHNGVEPPERRRAPGAVRAELGIPADAAVVGAVARLATQKRFDRLLRAFAALGGDAWCVLAGDGPEREALEALAAELGLSARVRFLGHREDRGDVLAAMDLYVVTSDTEGMSNAMLEALAAGVPVLSTPVSGADEALDPLSDGRAPGVIVGFEEEAISAALRDLLSDRERLKAMGQAARERAEERFGFEGMLDRWEAVLEGARP